MKPVKVAVVGVGYLGKFHAEKYARMEDVDLVGVVPADCQLAEMMGRWIWTYPSAYFAAYQHLPFADRSAGNRPP